MKLVFSTANKNKIREVSSLLPQQLEILSLDDIGCTNDIPETSPTIALNALQKAAYVYKHYKLDNFSEDTGLEVFELDNEPGVYSARYAGPAKDANNNIDLLLKKLEGSKDRKARFKTVVALIIKGREFLFEGIIKGSILPERRGTGGFGYDPVFQPEGYDKSFAELDISEKNKISHRALAINKLVSFLEHYIKENIKKEKNEINS